MAPMGRSPAPVSCSPAARSIDFSHLDWQFRRKDVHGCEPALAQGAQAQGIMAFGQAPAVVVHHQAAVVPGEDPGSPGLG